MVQFLTEVVLDEDSQGKVQLEPDTWKYPGSQAKSYSFCVLIPKGISITRMSSIEDNNLFNVIRANEVVMEVQIIATSIIYFTLPYQGSFLNSQCP